MNKRHKYDNRIRGYEKLQDKLLKVARTYSNIRLIIAFAAIVLCVVFYKMRREDLFIINLVVMLTAFIFIAVKHSKVIAFIKEVKILKNINLNGIKRIEGKFAEILDTGEEFKDEEHNYCNDLDIFGASSLFQWMNNAVTFKGRERLSRILKGNMSFDKNIIYNRQEAIKELSPLVGFRQRLQGKAIINAEHILNPQDFIEWGKEKGKDISNMFIMVLYIDSAVTIGFFIAAMLNLVSFGFFMAMVLLNVVIIQGNKKNLGSSLDMVGKHYKAMVSYRDMLRLIERRNYKSRLLKGLKDKIKNQSFDSYKEFVELTKLTETIEDRQNAIYLLLNILFFLDFHYYNKLNSWKKRYGDNIEAVLDVIAEFEELSSFADIYYNNDDYAFPIIKDDFIVKGEDIRHPLIGEKAVGNPISLTHKGEGWIITGSNMAGKSTYLRTIAINLVLAYSGSAVRAKNFECSPMEIYTCMRIGDNLEKSISSFYAEILRVKAIIESVKSGERVFYLLDEIFKGTNSRDRHKGAEILINELSTLNTLGLVSTHDLELGEIENEKISNYHFEEYYEDGKIRFDYTLRKGISTTQNALYLMRMAGINC
ncbi:MAG: DNA mismatch repair protein [Clostridium cadaveris]|uniref:MutS-related protein n=1 Tax=Clostridium cadaveris TaxID=1529 RepID=UPI002A8B94E4|nr:DNA mismatch repair protein [Clostridium cadaveris]